MLLPPGNNNNKHVRTEVVSAIFAFLSDSLFGRCVPANDADLDPDLLDRPFDFGDLSPSDASLLQLEIEQLREAGFEWAHPYTQCVLQNTIAAIEKE